MLLPGRDGSLAGCVRSAPPNIHPMCCAGCLARWQPHPGDTVHRSPLDFWMGWLRCPHEQHLFQRIARRHGRCCSRSIHELKWGNAPHLPVLFPKAPTEPPLPLSQIPNFRFPPLLLAWQCRLTAVYPCGRRGIHLLELRWQ